MRKSEREIFEAMATARAADVSAREWLDALVEAFRAATVGS